jgi:hypothetical protein
MGLLGDDTGSETESPPADGSFFPTLSPDGASARRNVASQRLLSDQSALLLSQRALPDGNVVVAITFQMASYHRRHL